MSHLITSFSRNSYYKSHRDTVLLPPPLPLLHFLFSFLLLLSFSPFPLPVLSLSSACFVFGLVIDGCIPYEGFFNKSKNFYFIKIHVLLLSSMKDLFHCPSAVSWLNKLHCPHILLHHFYQTEQGMLI